MKLKVFSTSRAIREYYENEEEPIKSINISEFEKRSVILQDREAIDEDLRILLLQEACIFKDFKKLKISLDFSSFYENSTFLFKFFDEMMNEKVSLKSLKTADSYGEYDEHIDVLEEILNNYTALLNKHNLYDKIITPSIYTLNKSFLLDFEEITVYLDGYLNQFEIDLFEEISKMVELKLVYETNSFTKKMLTSFEKLGFTLLQNRRYLLNLSSKTILKEEKLEHHKTSIQSFNSPSKSAQIAILKQRIYEYLKLGLEAKEIVIITPDESIANFIELFDDENNFNFAMGYSFTTTRIFSLLKFIQEFILGKSKQNKAKIFGLSEEELSLFIELKHNKEVSVFMNFIKRFELTKKEENIFLEELYLFERLLQKVNLSFIEALELFLNRLQKRSIDDSRGGSITVMGVLESRGANFKGVIVTDFNEEIVPKKSKKDIFLTSEIKKEMSLPTIKDRENLQKNYYYKLFCSASQISVIYVEDDTNKKSRFLDELNFEFKVNENVYNQEIEAILFDTSKTKKQKEYEIGLEYNLNSGYLSATKLKVFLDCKRKFYFKYIKKIKEEKEKNEDFMEKDIGNVLHEILFILYSKQNSFTNKKELKQSFLKEIEALKVTNILNKFYLDLWIKKLDVFFENEIDRFNKGYEVLLKEQKLECELEGFKLVGNVDRADIKENKLEIIDYKSGKVNLPSKLDNFTDFQSAFYYILAQKNGYEVECVSFYELKTGALRKDELIQEKIELLKETLKLYSKKMFIDFAKCEDVKLCKFCPYLDICQRN